MPNNGQTGEPQFSAPEMMQGLCDSVGELRDLFVRGFTREDAGINSDRGGASIPYLHFCSDGVADQLLRRTCRYPYVHIFAHSPFAVQIRALEDSADDRVAAQWLPFYDGFANLKLVPGQSYAVLNFGGGGALAGPQVDGTICIFETQSPIILKPPSYGPFPASVVDPNLSVNSTPNGVLAAVTGYATVVTHVLLRRLAAGNRLYNIENGSARILYQVQLEADEAHSVTFPRGSELYSTDGALQIRDDNAVASPVNVFMLAKRIPNLR